MSGTEPPRRIEVGTSFSTTGKIAVMVTVVMVLLSLTGRMETEEESGTLPIATGRPQATYFHFASALDRVLEATGSKIRLDVQETGASYDNMGRLSRGEAPLAIVQSDTPPVAEARLVAELYDEPMHILVRSALADTVKTVDDLEGLRVSVGGPGSGTHRTSTRVLSTLGIRPGQRLSLDPGESADALRAGQIDAMMWMTMAPTKLVRDLVRDETVILISLDDSMEPGSIPDALHTAIPALEPSILPARLYGAEPSHPLSTVTVSALLIAHRGVSEGVIRELTATLHQERLALGRSSISPSVIAAAAALTERYDPTSAALPYHPGAIAHYQRDAPSFLVTYAEALSLLVSLMVGMVSLLIAMREWLKRRRKNRIDRYYGEVRVVEVQLEANDDLEALRLRLLSIHRRAFDDLIEERLDADASFVIFQDYLSAVQNRVTSLQAAGGSVGDVVDSTALHLT